MPDTISLAIQLQRNASCAAFLQQHVDDLFRGLPAEQLPAEAINGFLFEVFDSMPLHHLDEIPLRITAERAFAEMGVG